MDYLHLRTVGKVVGRVRFGQILAVPGQRRQSDERHQQQEYCRSCRNALGMISPHSQIREKRDLLSNHTTHRTFEDQPLGFGSHGTLRLF